MPPEIKLRDLPPEKILVKKATCAHGEIGPTFAVTIQSVGACLKASEARMGSAPIAVYLQWREHDCDMAVGCKPEGSVTLSNGCEWLETPAGMHAVTSHFGPYTGLHDTHAAIHQWCKEQGMKILEPSWESYPVDPGREPDASKWQTDIHYPVTAS